MSIAELLTASVVAAGVLGLIIPHVQAILQKPWWSPRAKAITTVILSAIFGLITYTAAMGLGWIGSWDPTDIAAWVIGVYAASAVIYARLARPAGTAPYLETHVNAGPRHAA